MGYERMETVEGASSNLRVADAATLKTSAPHVMTANLPPRLPPFDCGNKSPITAFTKSYVYWRKLPR